MVLASKIYLTEELFSNLANRNIPNYDMNYTDMENHALRGTFSENQNVVKVTNLPSMLYEIVGNNEDSSKGCFLNCQNLTDAPDFTNVECYNITGCFYNCSNLVNVPSLPNNVISLSAVFKNCSSLVNAPVIPNSVTDMIMTFSQCHNLVNVPAIPNSIKGMRYAFEYCSNLVNAPDLSNCTNLRDMEGTFADCSSLVNAPVIPNSVNTIYWGFVRCNSLVNAPEIPDSVINMSHTFSSCINLVNVNHISNNVDNMDGTFAGCSNLVNVPDLSNCTSLWTMDGTFVDCINLVKAPRLPDYNNLWGIQECFRDCTNLVNAPIIPYHVADMNRTFSYCYNLTNIPTIPDSVIYMAGTFWECESLINVPKLSNNVRDMNKTFKNCQNLTGDIIISSTKVLDATDCFNNTSLDKNVYIPFNSVVLNADFHYGALENNGIANNFSWNDYITLDEPFLPGNNTWEIMLKVKTPVSNGRSQYIFGSDEVFYYTVGGERMGNGRFGIGFTSTGTSWDIGWVQGSTYIDINTWYYIKISFTGSEYKFETSTDKENWTLEGSVESSTPIFQDSNLSKFIFGNQGGKWNPWLGEIDFKECYIKIGSTITWTGTYNGVTPTYNSFINAGYGTDPTNRVDGVCLFDIESLYEVDLTDWDYTLDANGNAILEDYIGSDVETLVIPRTKI